MADNVQLDEDVLSNMSVTEEECVGAPPEPPLSLLCSPSKRPSLPDAWKLLPQNPRSSRDSTVDQWPLFGENGPNSAQLHRQLMALRLHRKTGAAETSTTTGIPAKFASILMPILQKNRSIISVDLV